MAYIHDHLLTLWVLVMAWRHQSTGHYQESMLTNDLYVMASQGHNELYTYTLPIFFSWNVETISACWYSAGLKYLVDLHFSHVYHNKHLASWELSRVLLHRRCVTSVPYGSSPSVIELVKYSIRHCSWCPADISRMSSMAKNGSDCRQRYHLTKIEIVLRKISWFHVCLS